MRNVSILIKRCGLYEKFVPVAIISIEAKAI